MFQTSQVSFSETLKPLKLTGGLGAWWNTRKSALRFVHTQRRRVDHRALNRCAGFWFSVLLKDGN